MAMQTGFRSRGSDRIPFGIDLEHLAFGEDRFAWRLPTQEGLTWRLATMNDLPQLRALWAEMDAKLGKQDKPDLFDMPVLLTLVAVDDLTGEIATAIYGECVVDWTMIGTSRRAARTLPQLHPWLALFLFPRKIRLARILVPRRLERHMERMLPGFRNITQQFAQFVGNVRS